MLINQKNCYLSGQWLTQIYIARSKCKVVFKTHKINKTIDPYNFIYYN